MDFLSGLNDAQKSAVLQTEGPVLIVAGAGAGKTKTVVHRICHIVSLGTKPSEILAVTFTNKAAKEMRERAIKMLEGVSPFLTERDVPFISTFHSLGVFLLRKFGVYEQKVKRFTILDDSDAMSLIKDAIRSFGLDPKEQDPKRIKNIISSSANKLLTPDDLMNESNPSYRLAGRIWGAYKKEKHNQNALDFDDLLLETINLLQKDPEARAYCHKTWKYIHIDEYQDTNEVQYTIAKILAEETKNICVVGDSDQSIYSWRGANIKNILEFEHDYQGVKTVLLEENYRSTKTVINVANEIIKKNNYRTVKNLFTNNTEGEKISVYSAYDETDEANFIAERALEYLDKGIDGNDIAVLFRTNFQSRVLEEAFLSYSLPYQVLGVRFFERKEIKEVISYIQAAFNPQSLIDIKKVINVPARGIGKVTIAKLFAEGPESFSGKAKISIDHFFEVLKKIKEYSENHNVSETIKYTVEITGLEKMYEEDKTEGEDRLNNLKELVTIGVRYNHLPTLDGLENLTQEATLMSDQDNLEQQNGVKLMTIHASKGLEFKIVFVVGLEQGLFPQEREMKQKAEDAEEERRLMYVAVTRARQKLFLSYASVRTIFGLRDIRLPSEFLMDVPDELIQRESRNGEAGFGKVVYL